jgi:hypothetical protein
MLSRSLVAAAVGFCAGPAVGQPAQPDAGALAAIHAVEAKDACLAARARGADDRVSDPWVIAGAVTGFCRAEEDRALAAMNAYIERHPGMAKVRRERLTEQDRLEMARLAVLVARALADAGDTH